jgi:SAM-dependent methyltransferase
MKRDPLDTTAGFPEDYHDYVFKNGRFVGAFDDMYRHAKGVPWDQDKRCNDWYAEVGLLMLRDSGPFDSILEMGCGLGYYTAKLRRYALREGGVLHAFDVSEAAIAKAREVDPQTEFWVDDVTRAGFTPRRQYDLVVIRDVFWYIFEHMEQVVSNLAKCVRPGGMLYVCQSFPALDRPFVGKDVLPSPDALIAFLDPRFTAVTSMRLRRHHAESDGPILHYLAEAKG